MRKYITRTIEKEIMAAAKEFPVIILTGPRQTGKSTLLQKIFPDHNYVTLDDPLTRKLAHDDPRIFLSRAKKMIIDEIQYVPDILPYIKISVDQNRDNLGHFILTGSQYFPLISGISESLAGRAALYELLGFSTEEIHLQTDTSCTKPVFSSLFDGFFPEVAAQGANRNRFYSSYLQTYLERDIRQITSVHDLKVFQNFLELLAARSGGLLNLHEISKECGISFSSARRWLSLLETTRIIYLLRPYTKNITKRVIKSPKLYFTDTGLLSYLLRYPDAETMASGPQAGAFFETFIIGEILKYKFNHNSNFELYFYRDSNHNEIDVVLDYGLSSKLLEIKLTATPKDKHFDGLKKIIKDFSNTHGYLISLAGNKETISKTISMAPWQEIIKIL